MPGYETFQKDLLNYARRTIRPLLDVRRDELAGAMGNHLFDLAGDQVLRPAPHDPDIEVFRTLFYGFAEIAASLEALADIELYIRRFPYAGTRVTRVRHLRYHIENYFAELYILRERLRGYLARLGRLYRKHPRHVTILAATRPLFRVIDAVLDPALRTRGVHTHETRLTSPDLDRLATWELVSSDKDPELMEFYSASYRATRRNWTSIVVNTNASVRELLDIVFERLHPALFDTEGHVLRPSDP